MTNPLNESTIEHHAIVLFQELGYAFGPDIGAEGDHQERADYTDALLLERLRSAIHTLNPAVPKDIRDEALRMVRDAAHGGLVTQNNLIQHMLVEGVRIAYQVDGEERGIIVRLLDYDHPEKNDLLVVNQYTVIHDRINRRADLVVFLNGIPLGLFELKNMADANATTRKAWNQLQTYQVDIPNLMAYNAVLVISDGLKAAVGCLGAPYERFLPWKTIDQRFRRAGHGRRRLENDRQGSGRYRAPEHAHRLVHPRTGAGASATHGETGLTETWLSTRHAGRGGEYGH